MPSDGSLLDVSLQFLCNNLEFAFCHVRVDMFGSMLLRSKVYVKFYTSAIHHSATQAFSVFYWYLIGIILDVSPQSAQKCPLKEK